MEQNVVSENKQVSVEVEKNGKKYYFVMPDNSPVGEAYDAAYLVLLKIVDFAKQITENSKRVEVNNAMEVVEAEVVQKGD